MGEADRKITESPAELLFPGPIDLESPAGSGVLAGRVGESRTMESRGGSISSAGVSDLLQRAEAAFRRDLPQLLEEQPGRWVAYRGDQRVGFSDDDFELYRRCQEQGYDLEEFIVEYVEPRGGDVMLMGPESMSDLSMDEEG